MSEEQKYTEVEVKISIWLPSHKRDSFLTLYETMLSNYINTIELVYSNIKERFEQYQKEEYEKLMNQYRGTNIDPADIDYSDIGSEASYRVERDLLMRYQYHFSSLVNLYQVFEQQIRKYLYKELNHRLSQVRTKDEMPNFATTFGEIKNVLKVLNYPIGRVPSWSTIDELNKIANTYKHGDGNSAKSLYRKNKTIFANQATPLFYYQEPKSKEEEKAYIKWLDPQELVEYRVNEKILFMTRELTTNTEIVLREDKTPYSKYVKAILDFWDSFPEHYETMVKVNVEETE
jgi:hypothetical protein